MSVVEIESTRQYLGIQKNHESIIAKSGLSIAKSGWGMSLKG